MESLNRHENMAALHHDRAMKLKTAPKKPAKTWFSVEKILGDKIETMNPDIFSVETARIVKDQLSSGFSADDFVILRHDEFETEVD